MAEGGKTGKGDQRKQEIQAWMKFWTEAAQEVPEDYLNMLKWYFMAIIGDPQCAKCKLCEMPVGLGAGALSLIDHMCNHHMAQLQYWLNPPDPLMKRVSNHQINAKLTNSYKGVVQITSTCFLFLLQYKELKLQQIGALPKTPDCPESQGDEEARPGQDH